MATAKFHVPIEVAGPTGATAATRYAGGTASGAPASGTFAKGDFVVDQTGKIWVCTTAGSPGTWTQAGGTSGTGAGTELDYVEATSPLTITATSAATAQTFITGNSVSYDGSTRICVEMFAPYVRQTTANQAVYFELYDGSTDLGTLSENQPAAASGTDSRPHLVRTFLTPSAASHAYHFKVFKSGGTVSVGAGARGANTLVPAYIRVTKA